MLLGIIYSQDKHLSLLILTFFVENALNELEVDLPDQLSEVRLRSGLEDNSLEWLHS